MKLLIKNGRVVDPASRTDAVLDILISGGKIADVKARIEEIPDRTIDASGLIVVPGLIDMHVHLRQPGFEHKETIATGSRAAAKGGFTTIACMPNTDPVNDSPETTGFILAEAERHSPVHILPIAAVTRGLKGTELTDMEALVKAGAVAFSDDGQPVPGDGIMRRALEKASGLGALIIDHCEDKSLAAGGSVHDGIAARRLGLRGIPSASEENPVRRDISLAAETGARVHIAHLSVQGAVRAVAEAKALGTRVSAEATPHHLLLRDEDILSPDTNFKMNPPLRGADDVAALRKALLDGTIDVIATDHAPHTEKEKAVPFGNAPFGIVGLETAVSLILDGFVSPEDLSLTRFAELMSFHPARLLGLSDKGRIASGADADLTLLDLEKRIVVDKTTFVSRSRNTPFNGWALRGAPVMTIVGGAVVYPFDVKDALS